MPAGVKRELQVHSSTLVSAPAMVTEPGTKDAMPQAAAPDTSDSPPLPKLADQSPLDRGDKVVASTEYLSWKALQGSEAPGGMMAGAGGMSDHAPMAGVVQKNKAPF